MNAKWKAAHSPEDYDVTRLWFWITDVSARNDWLSPLLYGFAPLAFFARGSRKRVRELAFSAAYLFATWWLFTHRLDRFWVPMLPVIATLAGIGAVSIRDPGWRIVRTVVLIACLAFNLRIVTSPLGGPNAYLVDLDRARVQVAGPSIAALNQLPAGSRVLCVGEAGVFDITVPVVYNTVFDESIFQQWCEDPGGQGLRPAAEIRERLRDEGITHLFVNWAEILRYRATYGYTEFVTPDRFDSLQQMGILESPIPLGRSALPTGRELTEWKRWGNSLRAAPVMTPDGPVETWTAQQLFPVVESIRRR